MEVVKEHAMETRSHRCVAYGEDAPEEHRELIVELAGFDSAIQCLDCLAGVAANRQAAQHVLYCCRRLERHLLERFSGKEQIDVATLARISPEYAEFARTLRLEHEELCSRLANFSRTVQELERADDPYEAMHRLKEEGERLGERIGRHLAVERSQLAGYL